MYNIVVKKLSYVPALCYPVHYLHSTGMSVPVIPETLPGIDHAEVSTEQSDCLGQIHISSLKGYENVSLDPKDFEGKAVLILGKGTGKLYNIRV